MSPGFRNVATRGMSAILQFHLFSLKVRQSGMPFRCFDPRLLDLDATLPLVDCEDLQRLIIHGRSVGLGRTSSLDGIQFKYTPRRHEAKSTKYQ